jgi:putative addiction module killer protein
VAASTQRSSRGESRDGAGANGGWQPVQTSNRSVTAFSNTGVNFGPGYRIYFGRDGERLAVLLAGGTKKRRLEDIRQSKANWQDCRNRKTQEKTPWR